MAVMKHPTAPGHEVSCSDSATLNAAAPFYVKIELLNMIIFGKCVAVSHSPSSIISQVLARELSWLECRPHQSCPHQPAPPKTARTNHVPCPPGRSLQDLPLILPPADLIALFPAWGLFLLFCFDPLILSSIRAQIPPLAADTCHLAEAERLPVVDC